MKVSCLSPKFRIEPPGFKRHLPVEFTVFGPSINLTDANSMLIRTRSEGLVIIFVKVLIVVNKFKDIPFLSFPVKPFIIA